MRASRSGTRGLEISEPVRGCSQDNDGYCKCREILLKGKIPINGDEDVELLRGERKQFSVPDG
jgi:hypothetical protein